MATNTNTDNGEGLDLLPPETVAILERTPFKARGFMEGFVTGRHRSPHKGQSVEFVQHRPYVPGDDIRNLDWNVLARSDRYFIRQYVEETNLRATVLLDASASMSYRGLQASSQNGVALSKFEYARYLAAAFAYLMVRQQESVGLVTFDRQIRQYLPGASRASQLRLLLAEMDRTQPGDETDLAPVLHEIAERVHRRGLIVLISDLFDRAEEIVNALHHFRHRQHEVVVLHVMAEEELDFPFKGVHRFRNLEKAGHDVTLDPYTLKAAYLERLRVFLETVRGGCGELRVDYVPLSTATPYGQVLADYLSVRPA